MPDYFELLKKDIIMLISSVVKDIANGRLEKKYLTLVSRLRLKKKF